MYTKARKLPLRMLGIIFLVLTIIGQPVALACTSCGSMPLDRLISTPEAKVSPHAHHNMGMITMGAQESSPDSYSNMDADTALSDSDHDCCKDKECSGSHCVSPSASFSSLVILSFAPLSDQASDIYRDAYIDTVTDSPYKPPILG